MSNEEELKQAVELIKVGRKKAGGRILTDILRTDPENERAWLWVTTCVDNDEERKYCLEQVLRINPNNHAALKALEKIEGPITPPDQPISEPAATEDAPPGWNFFSEPQTNEASPEQENVLDPAFPGFESPEGSLFPIGSEEYNNETNSQESGDFDTKAILAASNLSALQPKGETVLSNKGNETPAGNPVLNTSPDKTASAPSSNRFLKIILGVILVVVLACVACVGGSYFYFNNQMNRLKETTSKEFQVEYIVSGTSPQIAANFSNAKGDSEALDVRKTPYSRLMNMPGMTPLLLVAENKAGSGTIGCEIKVNGKTVSTNSSSQPDGQVTCTSLAGVNP